MNTVKRFLEPFSSKLSDRQKDMIRATLDEMKTVKVEVKK